MLPKRIITEYIKPPIPTTRFDWWAAREDYEPGDLHGFGRTEQEAIDNLLLEEEDRAA